MKWRIHNAAVRMRQGGIIAYPTESVYGLGCDPFNSQAVMRLLELKQRDWRKGLILVAADFQQIEPLVCVNDITALANTMQRETNVVSWLIPRSHNLPSWISGQYESVAIRLSRHPVIIDLCREMGHAIVSTSANPSTRKPATTAMQVRQYFGDQLDAIIHSHQPCDGQPSQLLQYPTRHRLR